MKTVFAVALLMFLSFAAFAQIAGQLTSTTGQPIPFANVLLIKSIDSSFVNATLTNDKGNYQLGMPETGHYRLRLSSVGYQTWTSPSFELTAGQTRKDFGTQIIPGDTKQLGEVVVRAEKPAFQQTAEGTVVNVESSVMSKGSSALQILERSPGVVVDYRNNSIALNGKSGVMVMLNGKLMRIPLEQVVALLAGMSANDIATIELLTTPGARYDAEGSAGIINIVLKKTTRQGTNGSFSLTGGYGWGEKGTGTLNLSHNTRTVDLYGSYSFMHDRTYSAMSFVGTQNMPALGGLLEVIGVDTTHATQNNHDLSAGIDSRLNTKTTIGSRVSWNLSDRNSTNFMRWESRAKRSTNANPTSLPDSLLFFRGTINGTNSWKNGISSFYAERKLREGEQLNLDVDYLYFRNSYPSEVRNTFHTEDGSRAGGSNSLYAARQRGFANTTIQVGVVKLDYVKQLSPKMKLEMGAKQTYTRTNSEAGIESLVDGTWVNRTETIGTMVMKESIGATYASVNAQLKPSINLIVGGRYEQSRTQMDNPKTGESLVNRRLGVLFPSVFFSKKIREQTEVHVSYTKRISRPSYTDLASFVRYSDPSAVYSGNPLLKPTITNNLKLGFSHQNYSFSLLFSRDDHPIARYQLTEGPARNLLYVSPQNLSWQYNINFQATIPVKVSNWWDMSYGFTGGLRQFKAEYTPIPAQKTYFGYSANFSQLLKLPRSFSAELSGWYNSVSYNGTTKVGGMGALNAGIKKELKKNGGTFQLAVTDLLQTMRINVYYGTVTKEAFSIKNHVRINPESRLFRILKFTYSRSFGSTQASGQSRQNNGSQDERDRVQKN